MESFRGGNFPAALGSFPDAAGTSQSRKIVPFSSGNFPIQKDGIFVRREAPGAAGSVKPPVGSYGHRAADAGHAVEVDLGEGEARAVGDGSHHLPPGIDDAGMSPAL